MVALKMKGAVKSTSSILLLILLFLISCQAELEDSREKIVENVTPIREELVASISEVKEEAQQIVQDTSANILEGTKDLVETTSSNLKEVGQKIAGDEINIDQNKNEPTLSSDDGTLDLSQFSFEQQKIDRDKAAAFLLEVREKRIIIEPGEIPDIIAIVNIAAYARSTDNPIGKRVYARKYMRSSDEPNNCSRFPIKDDAQRYFLANGGPELDPLKLDPDGDGYACFWNPEAFRLIILED
jgi:hypothetical protein